MDKNFIKDNGFNDVVERFRQINSYKSPKQSLHKLYERKNKLNEYTFITASTVNEDGEDNDGELQTPDTQGGGQQMDNTNQQPQENSPMDNPNQGDGINGQMGAENPSDGSQMPQNDMQQGVDTQSEGGEGNIPNDLDVPEVNDEEIETEEMEADDEVISVDELTQSQEATEYKIDGVDDRLSKLYAIVKKFSDQLDRNGENIMALKDEFERRNPTEEEKLNIRSQSSFPYSETPKDYWDKKKEQDIHYNVMYDNEVSPSEEQKKFEIMRGDISGLDMKSISDTLNIDQKLDDYLNF